MGCTISFESQNQAGSRDGSGAVVHGAQREKRGKLFTGRLSTATRNFGRRREGVNVCSLDAINFLFLWMKLQVLDIVGMYSGWAGIE